METITLTQNQLMFYELIVTILSMGFGAFVHQIWIDRKDIFNLKNK